ncbi:hypothetical protein [Mycoplasmopsis citelli]|uniref:hypothetical protein n=1 Tax=Mycoplasmopsis citelli TaxID=171281 RepID=UPI00101C70D2|nr:hypothetical protein [Mycoplasmopsis citelli]
MFLNSEISILEFISSIKAFPLTLRFSYTDLTLLNTNLASSLLVVIWASNSSRWDFVLIKTSWVLANNLLSSNSVWRVCIEFWALASSWFFWLSSDWAVSNCSLVEFKLSNVVLYWILSASKTLLLYSWITSWATFKASLKTGVKVWE